MAERASVLALSIRVGHMSLGWHHDDNFLSQESWDKSYPEPDLRLIIIDGTKEEEGWQAPAVLNDKAINILEEAGWGLCHMEMPDYMKKQTIPQVVQPLYYDVSW